mgnify:CR=1 FL=1
MEIAFRPGGQPGGTCRASGGGHVKQFDAVTLQEGRAFKAEPEWLFPLDYDPVAALVAAGSYAGRVTVWDVKSGRQVSSFQARPGAPGATSHAP